MAFPRFLILRMHIAHTDTIHLFQRWKRNLNGGIQLRSGSIKFQIKGSSSLQHTKFGLGLVLIFFVLNLEEVQCIDHLAATALYQQTCDVIIIIIIIMSISTAQNKKSSDAPTYTVIHTNKLQTTIYRLLLPGSCAQNAMHKLSTNVNIN